MSLASFEKRPKGWFMNQNSQLRLIWEYVLRSEAQISFATHSGEERKSRYPECVANDTERSFALQPRTCTQNGRVLIRLGDENTPRNTTLAVNRLA